METLSASTTFRWYPLTLQTMAMPMPVLPDDGSIKRLAGFEDAFFLRLLDHRQCDPVLHRTAGVLPLELDEEADRGIRAQRADIHQRGVADQVQDGAERGHQMEAVTVGIAPPATAGRIEISSESLTGVSSDDR